jgi:hypothetical protein
VVAEALVDAALQQDQAAEAVALGLEVRGVVEPLREALVLVRPDVLDLEGAAATLGDQVLEVRGAPHWVSTQWVKRARMWRTWR